MTSADVFTVTTERTGTTVRIIASGELDIATAAQLRDQTDLCLADHAEIIVVDLSEITFIDSTGIRALLEASVRGSDRVRVIPNAVCLRLFDLVGLTHRLPLATDGDGTAA
jgi:anti-anti-sigma factor